MQLVDAGLAIPTLLSCLLITLSEAATQPQIAAMQKIRARQLAILAFGKYGFLTANFFMDASGNHFMYAEANEDQAALLKTYEILQYNHLFDKENRLQSLFEFKPGFNAQ